MNSFFSRLFGSRSNETSVEPVIAGMLMEPVQVTPELALPMVLAKRFDKIRPSARQTVKITASPTEDIHIRQSSFGSYPCIPKDFDYPRDQNGAFMYPLAQINFSEVPHLPYFPKSGFLQFYVSTDDSFGLRYDQHTPSDMKILFFEEEELLDPDEDLNFLDAVLAGGHVPVYKPHTLNFELKTEYVGLEDINGLSTDSFDLDRIIAAHPKMKKELEDAVYDHFSAVGHKLGGYAYFTQWDPREGLERERNYMLLFQIDSDDEIAWGDLGVANFFIDPADLQVKDFSRVLYHWDCT